VRPVLATVTQMQMCTECQLQAKQLDVCMQELQLKASKAMQQHLSGHAAKTVQQMNNFDTWLKIVGSMLISCTEA